MKYVNNAYLSLPPSFGLLLEEEEDEEGFFRDLKAFIHLLFMPPPELEEDILRSLPSVPPLSRGENSSFCRDIEGL